MDVGLVVGWLVDAALIASPSPQLGVAHEASEDADNDDDDRDDSLLPGMMTRAAGVAVCEIFTTGLCNRGKIVSKGRAGHEIKQQTWSCPTEQNKDTQFKAFRGAGDEITPTD